MWAPVGLKRICLACSSMHVHGRFPAPLHRSLQLTPPQGHYANVYAGKRIEDGTPVAIKILQRSKSRPHRLKLEVRDTSSWPVRPQVPSPAPADLHSSVARPPSTLRTAHAHARYAAPCCAVPSFLQVQIMRRAGKHPGIVQLLDVYETDTTVELVLEYMDKGELFDRIIKRGPYSMWMARGGGMRGPAIRAAAR